VRVAADNAITVFTGPGLRGGVIAALLAGGCALGARRVWRSARASRDRQATLVLAALFLGAISVAFVFSLERPAWNLRYLAALLGPLLLLCALLLARAGRPGLVVAAATSIFLALTPVAGLLRHKSNAAQLGSMVAPYVRPTDVVITDPADHVVLARYLPRAKYATVYGPVGDPSLFDWSHALTRLRRSNPAKTLGPMLSQLPIGTHVFLVLARGEDDRTPWGAALAKRDAELRTLVQHDARLHETRTFVPPHGKWEDFTATAYVTIR
jgi:hypothetical protein